MQHPPGHLTFEELVLFTELWNGQSYLEWFQDKLKIHMPIMDAGDLRMVVRQTKNLRKDKKINVTKLKLPDVNSIESMLHDMTSIAANEYPANASIIFGRLITGISTEYC